MLYMKCTPMYIFLFGLLYDFSDLIEHSESLLKLLRFYRTDIWVTPYPYIETGKRMWIIKWKTNYSNLCFIVWNIPAMTSYKFSK